jgi:glucosamine--fructose-6-phosphate aminotransferase (isomerizing)
LVVGVSDGEYYLASDVAPIVEHTRQVIYLDDGEMVTLTPNGLHTSTIAHDPVDKEVHEVEWDLARIEKGGFEHFMLKEIHEQPESVRNGMRGRLLLDSGTARLSGLKLTPDEMREIRRIIILACGTSWHAGLIGEYMLEEHARIPVEVEYASEFRYRNPIVNEGTAVLVISQSGETADTLSAMREAQRKGARAFGIVNVVGSTIARESNAGVYIHAGPEIGVASTKAFTSQVTVLVSDHVGARAPAPDVARGRDRGSARAEEIPEKIQRIVDHSEAAKRIAEEHVAQQLPHLGRG